jgi:hypothetical protein
MSAAHKTIVVYDLEAARARLVCRHALADTATDEPIAHQLLEPDAPAPYVLPPAAETEFFVVDTVDLAALRRRCPALFSRRSCGSAS